MNAKLYLVEVGDALTISHGWGGYLIWELYIPEKEIVANEKDGCFKCECRAKGEIIDVEIDDEYAKAIETRALADETFKVLNKKFFDRVIEKYKDKVKDTMPKHLREAVEKAKMTFTTTKENDSATLINFEDVEEGQAQA
jgi:hypothetical protein